MQIIAKTIKADPTAAEALQFLLAQEYMAMGSMIGTSGSSKVMFMDPRSIPATMEGIKAMVNDSQSIG